MNLEKVSYVPVLNGTVLNCAVAEGLVVDGKRGTFYTKDGVFQYPVALINPYHHSDLFVKIKEKGLLSDNLTILADSGGLQEITLGEVKYSPEEVFQWQQKHSDIGFSVDSLPFITTKDGTNKPGSFGGWLFDSKNFLKHAEKSAENIRVTKKYRDRDKYPNFNFFGIIQGRQYGEYKQWYDVLRDDEYLEGYCVKAPNINPMTLAETCVFAIHNLNKPVHFLGIGNLSRSIVIYYANRHMKQKLTFDSSSYDVGAQYRSWLVPFMMNRKLRFVSDHHINEDKQLASADDVMRPKDVSGICDCVCCQTLGDKLGGMIERNDPFLAGMLSVHNLIMNLRWIEYVKLIINNPYKLKEFVRYNFEPNLCDKILKSFDMIDVSVERGPEYALQKYKDDVDINKTGGMQAGIFDF